MARVNLTNASSSGSGNRFSSVFNSKYPMNYNPDYMTLFEFEKYEGHESVRIWMYDHWQWSVYASGIYVGLVFGGQWLMRNREPFKLRRLLTIWNIFLAVFSAIAFLRSIPELLVSILGPNGSLHKSVCFLENHNPATSLWGLLFALSKIVEFGDTVFIVLRKQPLIFLHWYHHVTVCMFCWFAHGSHDPTSRWFADMNLFVHSLMYTYYALRSLQIKLPQTLALSITCLQITQMLVGIVISFHSYSVIVSGEECHRPLSNIYASLGMYATYFLLFANFFYKAYMTKSKKRKTA
ncbi:putative fatty acid elongation protein 3 [Folsomia candida]|uniref:Elongation of very long chain fatty acids protein n=1 Tax=Folsomia candida TaxID=158441 RepID=A0A226EG80_FOLCA|nr:putative fatty acid elongation protein 3 [Folsomia candida]OXA56605.1 putative fatty acid elongation protein 3 [Folsomia candida]